MVEPLQSESAKKDSKEKKTQTKWEDQDSVMFYKALELIGLDFTLMEQFFQNRSRKQLLRKFHKEKKKNPHAIEQALSKHQSTTDSKSRRYKNFLQNSDLAQMAQVPVANCSNNLTGMHLTLQSLLENVTKTTSEEEDIKPIDFYLKKTSRTSRGIKVADQLDHTSQEVKLEEQENCDKEGESEVANRSGEHKTYQPKLTIVLKNPFLDQSPSNDTKFIGGNDTTEANQNQKRGNPKIQNKPALEKNQKKSQLKGEQTTSSLLAQIHSVIPDFDSLAHVNS